MFHWMFIALKLLFQIFKGNTDVSTVVQHFISPSIMARYIKVHPGYYKGTDVCMRIELYGYVQPNDQGLWYTEFCYVQLGVYADMNV